MNAEVALAALLSLLPVPAARRRCIEARRDAIVAAADAAAAADGVPVGLLLAVGYAESALGCDPRSGGSWGAPISPRRRRVAGTVRHTTVALRHSYDVCGDWEAALWRFRRGTCRPGRLVGYAPRHALALWRRLDAYVAQGGTP